MQDLAIATGFHNDWVNFYELKELLRMMINPDTKYISKGFWTCVTYDYMNDK